MYANIQKVSNADILSNPIIPLEAKAIHNKFMAKINTVTQKRFFKCIIILSACLNFFASLIYLSHKLMVSVPHLCDI